MESGGFWLSGLADIVVECRAVGVGLLDIGSIIGIAVWKDHFGARGFYFFCLVCSAYCREARGEYLWVWAEEVAPRGDVFCVLCGGGGQRGFGGVGTKIGAAQTEIWP